MRLHQFARGTNPRRVIIYLREKGIELERVDVPMSGETLRTPEFLAMNPAGRIPVLELDDGRTITESAAIVEFLEELHPDPPMIGTDPVERAQVRALERIANDLIVRSHMWLLHSAPYFAAKAVQRPEVAIAARPLAEQLLAALDAHVGDQAFLAGDRPTIADCALFALFQSCRERLGLPYAREYARLDGWYNRFAARPSAAYE